MTILVAGCAAEAKSAAPSTASGSVTSAPAASAPASEATAQEPDAVSPSVTTREMSPDGILTDFYLPELMATLRVPTSPGPAPLVVVVPGGGWQTSDPVDYRPLAESLTASGISTSLITYSTTSTGAQFPRPIDDVACAVRWSAFQLSALGYPPSQVIVAGHSAGGQLAMEAAVAGDRFGADCPMPPVTIDGVVGLAGVYDLTDPVLVSPDLFADGGTAEERAQYSPITTVSDPSTAIPPLDVLLLSGANDVIVPASQPEQLAAAFRARGVEPAVEVLPLEHNLGFPLALEIAPIIKRWILGDAYVPPSPTAEVAAPPVDPASPAPVPEAVPPAASAAPVASPVPSG